MNDVVDKQAKISREFGFMVVVAFLVLCIVEIMGSARAPLLVGCLIIIFIFTSLAIWAPMILLPICKAWLKIGDLLGYVARPIILGMIFFGILTPLAIFLKLSGRDELKLKRKLDAQTYWVKKQRVSLEKETDFKNQF